MKTVKRLIMGLLLLGVGAISAKTFDVTLVNASNGDITVEGISGTFVYRVPATETPGVTVVISTAQSSNRYTISDGQSKTFQVKAELLESKNDTKIKVTPVSYGNKAYYVTFKSKITSAEKQPATITFKPPRETSDSLRYDADRVSISVKKT